MVNPQYFVNGKLNFGDLSHIVVDMGYKSAGFCFAGDTVTYEDSSNSLSIALDRIGGARELPFGLEENRVRNDQREFIRAHHEQIEELATLYEPYFDEYQGAFREAELHHDDPHIKRALRRQAYLEDIRTGAQDIETGLGLRTLRYKVKKDEFAKPRKKPRAIGDLGVTASLLGFRLLDCMKIAMSSEPFRYRDGVAYFVKSPKASELHRAFETLREPEGTAVFIYFSDDSVLAHRIPGGVHYFNLDIKSCDASHTSSLFRVLERLTPEGRPRDDMKRVSAQCALPFRLHCPEDPNRVCILQAEEEVLFSGSVATTSLNNVANLLIFMAIMDAGYDGTLEDGEAVALRRAALSAGYDISGCKPLEHFEQVQFLKHSPVRDALDQFHPMLNLGTLMRSYGIAHGDVLGRGSLCQRFEEFGQAMLRSAYPYSSNFVVEALRRDVQVRSEIQSQVASNFAYKVVDLIGDKDAYPHYWATTESIALRYGLDSADILELTQLCGLMRYGVVINCEAVRKILLTDYELDTTEEVTAPYTIFDH